MSGNRTLLPLDAHALSQWKSDGYLIIRRLFAPAELVALSEEAWMLTRQQGLIDKCNLRCRFQNNHDDSDCLWETFDPVVDISPLCKKFAFDPRLMAVLEDLYGESACLFKDKLIFKQPGTNGYQLHQDWIAWPGFPRSFLTVLIPIDESHEENGCTEVFPGYHQAGSLSPEDGEYHQLEFGQIDESTGVKLILNPGDIAIFGGFVPHRSAPNRTDSWRRQFYLSYNASSDGGDQREAHYEDFHKYLKQRYSEYGLQNTYFR